jgi:hypothetical protein
VFFKVDKNDIYIWRSIVCVCVFLWVCHFPVLARGARGRRLLIACLVLNKQEIAVNWNIYISIYHEKIYK